MTMRKKINVPTINAFILYQNKYMVDGKMITFLMRLTVCILMVSRNHIFSVNFTGIFLVSRRTGE